MGFSALGYPAASRGTSFQRSGFLCARRRRISGSCARLRTLLPRFEGRREDMASVLEMAVQFLRLVRPVSAWAGPA